MWCVWMEGLVLRGRRRWLLVPLAPGLEKWPVSVWSLFAVVGNNVPRLHGFCPRWRPEHSGGGGGCSAWVPVCCVGREGGAGHLSSSHTPKRGLARRHP